MTRIATLLAGAALVPALLLGGPATAASETNVEISAKKGGTYGDHLVGRTNLPVYAFTGDTKGGGNAEAERACDPACQEDWPPVVTQGEPQGRGDVRQELLGTIPHQRNAPQVTYDGRPLYYYAGGEEDEDRPAGQGISAHGGEWHLVRPSGELVRGGG